jgi:hypothetical protein
MCSPFDPLSCANVIAKGITGPASVVSGLAHDGLSVMLAELTGELHSAIAALSTTLAAWILVPSTPVCPSTGPDWVAACAAGASPAAQVRGWLLPITALIAVLGILWQGVVMVTTRRGEPLLIVLKGLFATALWGAIGIAGTQLAVRAGDAYAFWVLQKAIFGDSSDPTRSVGEAIASMSVGASITAALVLVLLQSLMLFATLAQIILMIFRDGAVIVLAGQLQLAAAGGFTRLTGGWLAKVTGWMLALIAYKPVAATIYAVAFALMGAGVRNLITGLAIMILAIFAMPAVMRLFNWGVGAIGNGSHDTLGLLGTTVAAGLHGTSVVRGLGGYSAGEHARWLDLNGPDAGPTGAGTASGPSAATYLSHYGASAGSSAPAAARTGASAAGAAATGGATLAAEAAVQVKQQAQEQIRAQVKRATDAIDGK